MSGGYPHLSRWLVQQVTNPSYFAWMRDVLNQGRDALVEMGKASPPPPDGPYLDGYNEATQKAIP